MTDERAERIVSKAQEWFENRFNPSEQEIAFRAMNLTRMYSGEYDRKAKRIVDGLSHNEAYELARWFAVSCYFRALLQAAAVDSDIMIDGKPIHDVIMEERNLIEQTLNKEKR